MGVWDVFTACAVAFVVGGNSGISPMLTLFLIGLIERLDPGKLNMSENVVTLLASWPSLLLFGTGTVLEFVSKCVPAVDQFMDSAMTFLVPVVSSLATLSTFGLFEVPEGVDELYHEYFEYNGDDFEYNGDDFEYSGDDIEDYGDDFEDYGDGNQRRLSVATSALFALKIMLVLNGICLALSMHAAKMIVRLIGLGWLTNCLALLEATWVIVSITVAVFIRTFAIFIGGFIVFVACYNVWCIVQKMNEEEETPASDGGGTFVAGEYVQHQEVDDMPAQKTHSHVHEYVQNQTDASLPVEETQRQEQDDFANVKPTIY